MSNDSQPSAALLVTDLDNTLWDWFAAWHASFGAMLEQLVEQTGILQAQLEREIRAVHQHRGTAEYSLLLEELPSLQNLHGDNVDLMQRYDTVMHTLNRERKRYTRLYDGVRETLLSIRARGIPIVAYTESIAFWTEWRIRQVGLDGVIDVLYSSPDHDWPEGVDAEKVRTLPPHHYGLRVTTHRHVPRGVIKPNTQILRSIVEDYGLEPDQAIYVGDSLTKDVIMAQEAGFQDVHAAYGVSDSRPEYELLRRVSHWTKEMIQRERDASSGRAPVHPSHTIQNFADLLKIFDFPASGRRT